MTQRSEVAASYARWHEMLAALTGSAPHESISEILHRVAEAACSVLDCRHAVISLVDDAGALEYLVSFDAAPDDPPADAVPGGLLGLPVSYGGRTIGGLYLAEPAHRDAFTEVDEQAAGLIAAGLGVTIRRLRLDAANDQRQRWLIESVELTRDLLAGAPADPLRLVVDRVQSMAPADLVAVVIERGNGMSFEVLEAAGRYADRVRGKLFDAAATSAPELIAGGEPRVLEGLTRADTGDQLVALTGADSGVLVPLLGPGRRHGMLAVLRRPERAPFSPNEVELTAMFATQMGLALELLESRASRERVALLDERDRIARDLHDHVIQRLFAVGLTVQGVGSQLPGESGRRLLATVDDIDATIAQIRSTIYRLSGPMLAAESSLRGQVDRLLTDLETVLGFRVELEFRGPVDFGTDHDLAQDCLAVLREALTNVARHAGATRATVLIALDADRLEIQVWDDGRGIGEQARRSGLANLRVRAEQRGGSLLLSSGDAVGSRLTWTIPWASAVATA